MQTNTYLFFDGDCKEAFEFYAQCFGVKIEMMVTGADTPANMPEMHDNIMHARIKIGDSLLMGSDARPERHNKPQGFDVNVTTNTPKEAERIFQALAEGGTVRMPLKKNFFAERFGSLVDRFGIPWMVNCE